MKQIPSFTLGLALSIAATWPVFAQDAASGNPVPSGQVRTDSTGIPFGTEAARTGTPQGKPAAEFTRPSSPLYLPQTVDGKPLTAATSSGRGQITSKLAEAPTPVPREAAAEAEPTTPEIVRGKYLTAAADCVVCHTAPGGKPFAGGLSFKTPFGTMFSSNITSDKETGIGDWTLADFTNAVKHGKRKDGANLYPSMTYTSYVALTDEDTKAIYEYLRTISAVHQAPPDNQMGFPYNQRWALTFWNLVNFKDKGFRDDPKQSAEYNRGAYVATALGHCAECHTPRNLTMGLKTGSNLAGASTDGWDAYNISPSKEYGIGSWSQADIVTYLKNGALPGKATAAGPMADVVSHSTRLMSNEDLNALVFWLKAQPAQETGTGVGRFSRGQRGDTITAHVRGQNAGDSPTGAMLYNYNCASCHGIDGAGIGKSLYYPSLFQNSATGSVSAANLVQVILNGVHRVNSQGELIVMPAFATELSPAEVATVANYVIQSFGDGKSTVTPEQVTKLRVNAVTVIPGWVLVLAGVVGALIAVALFVWIIRRHRRSQAIEALENALRQSKQ